ncbi:hypothetical protein [Acinetobacter sp. B51(2017)]|uniref:hypothetical protein n=1 Tax=Acinetobacter sp. B51(2017) TaxID=2060938 RepID=UPI000F078D78|nr:hypothetical protein [Acinetobacter sp. B51(2017)]
MKKLIISLAGAENTGKTQTLTLLIEMLVKDAFAQPDTLVKCLKMENADMRLIVAIGDIKVAVDTKGDPDTKLFERISELDSCDYIICACRTRGETYDAIQDFAQKTKRKRIKLHTYEVEPSLNRTNTAASQILNELKAQHIYQYLMNKVHEQQKALN